MNPLGVTAEFLQIEHKPRCKRDMKKDQSRKEAMLVDPYFNMVPRIITPKRLSPPNPTTIALSEVLVLLQGNIICFRKQRGQCSLPAQSDRDEQN